MQITKSEMKTIKTNKIKIKVNKNDNEKLKRLKNQKKINCSISPLATVYALHIASYNQKY